MFQLHDAMHTNTLIKTFFRQDFIDKMSAYRKIYITSAKNPVQLYRFILV